MTDCFEYLNNVYIGLCAISDQIKAMLKSNGIQFTCGFYNNHTMRRNGDFVTEYFPIPVITIEYVGDIGISLDEIWFEANLPKDRLLMLDFNQLMSKRSFALYGAEGYLNDLNDENDTAYSLREKVVASDETHFCVLYCFDKEEPYAEIVEYINLMSH